MISLQWKHMNSSMLLLPLLIGSLSSKVHADSVSIEKSCFAVGEEIQVDFAVDNIANFDMNWIGIYPANERNDSNSLPAAEIWSWLCGSGTCRPSQNERQGTLSFRSDRDQGWVQRWPLQQGAYRAVLSQGGDGVRWPALAISEPFEIGCEPSIVVEDETSNNNDSDIENTNSREMLAVVNRARRDIESLISDAPLLVGKFLRLAFHDCVGGCDGCVDFANPDNAGLVMPISFLEPIVEEYEEQGLSRTDIWMLSAVVASDVSEMRSIVDFDFQWIGRKTCEEINDGDCGLDADGQVTTCGPFTGPHREICHGDTAGTRTIQDFMSAEFDFDAQQTAAIMGAHSVGAMRDVNLGFDGRSGWDITNDELDQGYFVELVGSPNHPLPNWEHRRRRNRNIDNVPARWQYEAEVNGVGLTMLNSDIAMVRDLVEGENLMPDGEVTCNFLGSNQCSSNTPFLPFITQYAQSRTTFLIDYRDALEAMIENGYRRDVLCEDDEACVLTSRF